jgi:hypothetical protein
MWAMLEPVNSSPASSTYRGVGPGSVDDGLANLRLETTENAADRHAGFAAYRRQRKLAGRRVGEQPLSRRSYPLL